MIRSSIPLILMVLLAGCAHGPTEKGRLRSKFKPQELLELTCSPGQSIKEVKGVAWLKAKSPDASGQFPASIVAHAPSSLKLEVQQPLGGTAAVLSIEGSDLTLTVPGKPDRGRRGRDSWAGIPLKWAAALFLGRIPCPDLKAGSLQSSISNDDELVVVAPGDGSRRGSRYVYSFDEIHGRTWAKTLHWEGMGEPSGASVDFQFSDPETETFSPLKWEAKSKHGEVKIRWRDREIER